ncbi:protein of unknown function [Nitrospira japonica]|uniref:Uncharacterized protein n=1 Tax=Nitrospira japonica TaxID=1325564 RepID=A0A1W1IAD1_9BACT|nr:protein of unknown function [Nitrospira japonica]
MLAVVPPRLPYHPLFRSALQPVQTQSTRGHHAISNDLLGSDQTGRQNAHRFVPPAKG